MKRTDQGRKGKKVFAYHILRYITKSKAQKEQIFQENMREGGKVRESVCVPTLLTREMASQITVKRSSRIWCQENCLLLCK